MSIVHGQGVLLLWMFPAKQAPKATTGFMGMGKRPSTKLNLAARMRMHGIDLPHFALLSYIIRQEDPRDSACQ
ncbi:hypothetical protein BDP55DRAFT_244928 [Colletotrichum godetiae]|uniref:Uncharacterized protein n=1 Tax=Colletotrichum godetiae TaxID=1209918 RepID=A0AAJ0AF55_9PEZI|nr:uncharacterized protein BDP55DRAFT_244928 [Colletotrichum godetiae]KAK1672761.1 hypothetical protein BDP55DRAFT_244928 [Colletotrichum godetiae]